MRWPVRAAGDGCSSWASAAVGPSRGEGDGWARVEEKNELGRGERERSRPG